MMSSNRLARATATIARRLKSFDSSSGNFLAKNCRYLSTAPKENFDDMQVVIDRYNSNPNSLGADAVPDRLPNDAQDRNDLYFDEEAREMGGVKASIRNNWTKQEIADIFTLPFHELMYRASTVHRMYWDPSEVQQCTLLSIKTGGCTEDCSYCSQSTRR